MRDHNGFLVWGIMEPVHDLTDFQIQLWTVHKDIKEAFSRDFNNLLIETEHEVSFNILRRQNFDEASGENLVEPIRAINACNPLLPSDSEPIVRVYTVSEGRNQVARFVADFGMRNVTSLVEVDYSFAEMRNLQDIDIGWGPHLPSLEVTSVMGPGEVIQGPKPKKLKRVVIEANEYETLSKLNEKVARMKNLLEQQLLMMGSSSATYSGRADPVFALKATNKALTSQGMVSPLGPVGPVFKFEKGECSKQGQDKGKRKMWEDSEESIENEKVSAQGSALIVVPSMVHNNAPVMVHSKAPDLNLGDSISKKETGPSVVSEPVLESSKMISAPVVEEANSNILSYLYNSIMNMVDPPLKMDDFMSVDEVMLEFALYEELQMFKSQDGPNNASG